MAPRKRIGFVYSYNEKWIAGTYYILNIIHALKTLDDVDQPQLIILTKSADSFYELVESTKYPYLEYYQYPRPKLHYTYLDRIVNKLGRTFLNRNLIIKFHQALKIEFLYPRYISGLSSDLKEVNWIPDFQEDHLPQFFSENEIFKRKKQQREVYAEGDIVVLSSEDAQSDFKRLYPIARAKTFVLSFAVTHPDFSALKISDLLIKHNLPISYFFAPNQFWSHKNHMVILQAVNHLKDKGTPIVVAMSGNESDYRNQENIEVLKNYISEQELHTEIKFLGFLPQEEQLCIFKHATAIIQPSLFEGWSTVIEDAKALGKFAIASNLSVHREQLHENVMFFDPYDYMDLVRCIVSFIHEPPDIIALDYKKSIFEFGKKFNKLTKMASKETFINGQ